MPHARPDALLPDEVLVPGEVLVSDDGRFRFEFNADGYVRVWHYIEGVGPVTPFRVGPGNRFTLGRQTDTIQTGPGQHRNVGRPRLLNAAGATVWEANPINFRRTTNDQFVIQGDGNLVLYAAHASGSFANWGLLGAHQLPDRLYGRVRAVIPDATTVNVSTPGVILIETAGQGQGEIVNAQPQPVGVRTDTQHVKLDPGETVSLSAPGVINLDTAVYSFTGNSTTTRPNGDAIGVRPSANGRWQIRVGAFGLALTGPGPERRADGTPDPLDVVRLKEEGFPLPPLDEKSL